jgi:NADH:ubiquinone oxidoreductase subunit 6 (subunit J)
MAGRRNLILAGAFFGLIALVAVASRGHAPAGNGGTHGIDSKLIWEFVLLAFLALFIISLPVALWVILTTRIEAQAAKKRRERATWRIFIFLALLTVAVVVWVLRADSNNSKPKPVATPPTGGAGKNTHNNPGDKIPFDWLPAIVMLSVALVGAAVVAYLMFRKPAKRPPTEIELAAQLSAVLDDSLEDLYRELDPRKAVIATYARMETTLAGAGLPRFAAETPLEYLGRVLRELLHSSADAVARLTALFERAKFSTHEIDSGMKNDAIDALVTMRDELRAAAVS